MLITFKSKSSADVLMLAKHGWHLVQIMFDGLNNQDYAQMRDGVITAEQIPLAIQRLNQAIAQERDHNQEDQDDFDAFEYEPKKVQKLENVSLKNRSYPLMQMLLSAQKHEEPILWSVGSSW